ncbi:MAG: beta-propeller fold lactonase family protein [Candidatus Baltobacteraceae bacterium]
MPSPNRSGTVSSPFERNAAASQSESDETPCPPPTAPPTPSPPLPPATQAVDFVYAANEEPSSVSAYWVDRDGKLIPVRGSPFRTGSVLQSVTIDPTGRFLYAAGWDGGITAYAIVARTGALHAVAGSPFAAGRGPTSVAIDRGGTYAYANNINSGDISVYSIDAHSGALAPVEGSPFAMGRVPYRLVLNPRRHVAYVVFNSSIGTFDTAGGHFKQLGETRIVNGRGGGLDIAIDHDGDRLYATNDGASTISTYTVDGHTGALQPIPGAPLKAGVGPQDVRVDPSARFLYVANLNGSISAYAIDRVTGGLTTIVGSPFRGSDGPQAMTITPDGKLLYATNFSSRSVAGFAIDQRTGALEPVAGSPFQAGGHPWGMASCRRVGNRCRPY